MAAIGFNHYNLRAPRELLDKLKEFYSEVVGLSVGERPPFPSFGYWLYADGRAVLHLSEAHADEHRATNVVAIFDHVAFSCVNREEMEAVLRERDIAFQAVQVSLTGQVQLFFRDPAGNGVELDFA